MQDFTCKVYSFEKTKAGGYKLTCLSEEYGVLVFYDGTEKPVQIGDEVVVHLTPGFDKWGYTQIKLYRVV